MIEPVKDEVTGEALGFVATGGGWGHGVGMSQTGAVGMAAAFAISGSNNDLSK